MVREVVSKACLTRFIRPRLAMQLDTDYRSNVIIIPQMAFAKELRVMMTPRSLAKLVGVISFPNKVRRNFLYFTYHCSAAKNN